MHEQTFPPDSIEAQVVEVLKTCYDPEIPVNILEMGLIYSIETTEDSAVDITMTLTSPACPVAGTLPPEVEQKVKSMIAAVTDARIEVVWDPPWSMDMMSEAAKLELGMM
jgi:FeS assembly SUF system protein